MSGLDSIIKVHSREKLLKTPIFEVEKAEFSVISGSNRSGGQILHHYRISCGDWVTVLPIVGQNAILVKQPRIGTEGMVLETPGGAMNLDERDPTMAAARELEEETGLVSMRFLSLASINPNPALMSNRCHFFIALDCHLPVKRQNFPDPEENIEPVLVPILELDEWVRHGRVDHGLSALCIMLALKYVPKIVQ